MSLMIYNNIQLDLIKTNSVDRIAVWSPDNTEYMYTEFTISVSAVYSPSPLATSYGPTGTPEEGWPPVITDRAIRHFLMQPRKILNFSDGEIPIVQSLFSDDAGNTYDNRDGPLPISCSVRRIIGSRLWYIDYVIKTWVTECPIGSVTSPIASSRYSKSETIDDDYMSTITTDGVSFFRSDVLAQLRFNADSYREYLIPPPLLGYARKALSFSVSADGISVKWSTTDVEQKQELGSQLVLGTAASVGITKMSLIYTVTPPRLGATVKMAGWGAIVNIEVTARGQKYTNNLDMLKFCVRVAIERLGLTYTKGIMSDAMVSEDFFDHSVRLSLTYVLVPTNTDKIGDVVIPIGPVPGVAPGGFFGAPIFSLPNNTGQNVVPPFGNSTRGTAAYQLAVTAFANACFTPPDTVGDDTTGLYIPPLVQMPSLNKAGTSPVVAAYYSPPFPPTAESLRKQKQGAREPGSNPNPPTPSGGTDVTGGTGGDGSGDEKLAFSIREWTKSRTIRHSGNICLPVARNPARDAAPPPPSPPVQMSYGDPTTGSTPTPTPTPDPTPTANAIVIQLHQPYSERVTDWEVYQYGSPPRLPSPVSPFGKDDPLLVLLDSEVATGDVDIAPDGYTLGFGAGGRYRSAITNDVGPKAPVSYNIPDYNSVEQSSFTSVSAEEDYSDKWINNDFARKQTT